MFDDDIIIIDGSFILHRCFHAVRPDIDKALRIANNKFKSIANCHPDCDINVVFDKGGCTYRRGLNERYKANRPTLPDIFYTLQKRLIDHQLDTASNVYCANGIEGDDIIASIKKLKAVNKRCYIYTKDKDIYQLINDNCFIIDPFEFKVYDREACFLKHGVYPEKIWLKLCLMGDKADGIEGVDSIGPSTAIKLANKYNDLESLLLGESWLLSYKELLLLNKSLVSLRDDVI